MKREGKGDGSLNSPLQNPDGAVQAETGSANLSHQNVT